MTLDCLTGKYFSKFYYAKKYSKEIQFIRVNFEHVYRYLRKINRIAGTSTYVSLRLRLSLQKQVLKFSGVLKINKCFIGLEFSLSQAFWRFFVFFFFIVLFLFKNLKWESLKRNWQMLNWKLFKNIKSLRRSTSSLSIKLWWQRLGKGWKGSRVSVMQFLLFWLRTTAKQNNF